MWQDQQTDNELIDAHQSGDALAFEHLVSRYRPSIVAHAVRRLHDRDEAETVAQDVVLRIYRHLDNFEQRAQFSTWLYRVTENVCYTALTRAQRDRQKNQDYAASSASDAAYEVVDDQYRFAELVGCLSHDEQQLLALRFVEDLEIKDIANVTQSGLSATKMRIYRALAKMRAQLSMIAEAA